MARKAEDEALMEAFLASVRGLSDEEAGAAVGLTGERVRQYRAGQWKRLNSGTRRSLAEHVSMPVNAAPAYYEGISVALEKVERVADELRALRDAAKSPSGVKNPRTAVDISRSGRPLDPDRDQRGEG